MADVFTDGTISHGSATLTFTPAGGGSTFTGIADADFGPQSDTKVVEQTNANGEPTAAFGIQQTPTGSCTVQHGATAPTRGCTFTTDKTSSTVFIVTSARTVFAKEDYVKTEISYRQKIN